MIIDWLKKDLAGFEFLSTNLIKKKLEYKYKYKIIITMTKNRITMTNTSLGTLTK